MKLSNADRKLFYKLWLDLIFYINNKHKIVNGYIKESNPDLIDINAIVKIRTKLWENPHWIDDYLSDKKGILEVSEWEIVNSWRHSFIKGNFIIAHQAKKYAILMQIEVPAKTYGVLGITDSIKYTFLNNVPSIAEMVLLPFKNKIIYDTIIFRSQITFGSGFRKKVYEMYKEAIEKGIVEKLDTVTN